MPDGNVIPLRPSGIRDGDLPLPVEELSETVDAIGHCLAKLNSEPEPVARPAVTTATPFLLRLTIVEQQLEKLSGITVTTWPDVRWALRFCNARVRALTRIRESAASFHMIQGRAESLDARREDIIFVEVSEVGRVLRDLRDLIIERYPETRSAC